jgi:adenylate cyclase
MDSLVADTAAPSPLAAEARAEVTPVIDWLLAERIGLAHSPELFGRFCERFARTGVPIDRATIHIPQLHPQLRARSLLWQKDSAEVTEFNRAHGIETTGGYLKSPVRQIFDGGPMIRRHIEAPDCPRDFPILDEIEPEGCTDYTMWPLPFSSGGLVNAISFATRRPGGFSERDLAAIEAVLPAFGAVMEMAHMRRTARTLLETYLGPSSGERVLSGTIKRGDGEVINAVLWYCDLRGFTELSETLPLDEVIGLLNDYFEAMARPVKAAGGEILKFMGDAMLAIFPLAGLNPDGTCAACCTGLAVAEQALAGIAAVNAERTAAGKVPLRCGVSLARGDVMYGNIGDVERLDFTVIGPAVNLATRLEDLTRDLALDPPVVFSAPVAANCGRQSRSLGRFKLKGIADAQEAFTLA